MFAALDPKAMLQSATADAGAGRLLLRSLEQFFVIGIASDDRVTFLEQVSRMPGDMQLLWTNLLQSRLGRMDLVKADHGCGPDCRLPSARSNDVNQIAAGSDDVCLNCGSVHHNWNSLDTAQITEWCRSRQASNFIPRGSLRDELYSMNFASIARVAENCVIIDRYAGQRLSMRGDSSGLAWLGSRLVEDGVRRVVLVTASTKSAPQSDIEAAVGRLSNDELRRSIRLEIRSDSKFRDFAHDRHVLVQVGSVGINFAIGKGVEIFEHHTISQQSSFAGGDGSVVTQMLSDLQVDASAHFV